MFPNAKGSEQLSILATIDPASQAAGTVTTAWVSVTGCWAALSSGLAACCRMPMAASIARRISRGSPGRSFPAHVSLPLRLGPG